ncbi:hypothetical protein BB780_04840 [Stenotrophomonas maltophilia]|nr:hypothetical protein BB780_04840 [Stenotrophomonas maltophilia]
MLFQIFARCQALVLDSLEGWSWAMWFSQIRFGTIRPGSVSWMATVSLVLRWHLIKFSLRRN